MEYDVQWPILLFLAFQCWQVGKHQVQSKGHRQQQVLKVDQSVAIQVPSAEDGEGFLWNIRFKNVSVVRESQIFFDVIDQHV